MDMNSLIQMLIQRNPQVANNPRAQEMLKVIQSGDSKRGQEIARNLCKSYGISEKDAEAQARKFFGV